MAYGCASENRGQGPGQGQALGQYNSGRKYVLNPLNVSSPSKKSTYSTTNNKNQPFLKSSLSSSSLKDHGLSSSSVSSVASLYGTGSPKNSLGRSFSINSVNTTMDLPSVREIRPMGLGIKTLERYTDTFLQC